MTTIYLVRHAQAEGNLYRLVQGHFNGLITKRGYEQIRALRRRFDGVHIDAVYSSDLFRARTTARAVSEPRNLPIILREDLREVNLGWWEGLPWQAVADMDAAQLHNFHMDLSRFDVKDGESGAVVRDRMLGAIRAIAAENAGKTVAVFSHGAAMRILLGTIRGMDLADIDQSVLGDNTAVTLLEVEGDAIREIYGNDNSHLVEAGLTHFTPLVGKAVKRFEDGMAYRTMDEPAAAALAEAGFPVPEEGEKIAVWLGGKAAGYVQLLGCDGDTGLVGDYGLLPAFRSKGYGIQPMGQAVQYYRSRGCTRLRLTDVQEGCRTYFEKYGFAATTDSAMEMSIGYEDRMI